MKKVIVVLMLLIGCAVFAYAAEIGKDGNFVAYDNDTVLDKKTGLMWAAKDNGSNINWDNAKKYCETYRGGGYADWRLPTQGELEAIYSAAKPFKTACGFDAYLTNLIKVSCVMIWGSDTFGAEASSFYFGPDGGQSFLAKKSTTNNYRVLPVRRAK